MASFVDRPLRIGMIAGEPSGDLLAADLLKHLKLKGIPFLAEGIAGSEMQKQGCRSLFPIKALSLMGLGEILKQLPQLIKIRRQIIHYFLSNPPDIFIGIDAPEFNLAVEKKLKNHHIPTVHYVSPSVWAWRPWRIKKIAKAVDLMLTLFPFEQRIYQDNGIPVQWVGHPFADEIPFQNDPLIARQGLGLPDSAPIIAILPGSRANEIAYCGKVFLEAAQRCYQKNPALVFVAPMVNKEREEQFTAIKSSMAPKLPLHIIQGHSRQVMAAADSVLLASGSATLEAMLLKKPMIIAYRMSHLSYWMAKCLIKVDHIGLPNLLANKRLVPEFIQENASAENLESELLFYLNHPNYVSNLQQEFLRLHQQLCCNASEKAVTAILRLLQHFQK